ncbi:hypothetical protein GSI_09740 [Ganoderma sinense ZZ0214-1]|uniref:Endonuclease/exonuclease/phosphatase domain-containing protein n=1 Tax=Ganoderma sinense ZZ0214-1 TaxID=1077348 RepID=A0A2G8S344_9APHY|nr:hypothetical protein GSI_09740 [Ganoderma sinense ZZ0214-1]
MPPTNELPQLPGDAEGGDSQSTQRTDSSRARSSSAAHIGDQSAQPVSHATRAARTSSSTAKARGFDLPEIRPESVLATMLLSSAIPEDTATKNIGPLKRDVSLLAAAIDGIRSDARDYKASTGTDLLHLTTVAESILARLQSPHLFAGDDAIALRSVDDRLTRLAADVEQNAVNVDTEFNGVQQRTDGMQDSLQHLRRLYDDIDQTLQRLLRAGPPSLQGPPPAQPDHARPPPPFAQPPPSLGGPSPHILQPPPHVPHQGASGPPPAVFGGQPPTMFQSAPVQGFPGPPPPFQQGISATAGAGPSQPKRGAQGGNWNPPSAKRPRREPNPLPPPVPPGVVLDDDEGEEPHAFVHLGSVRWSKHPGNPLDGQVLFAVTPIFDADPSLRHAYLGPAFIPGEDNWVSLEFRTTETATTFVSLWFQHRDKTSIKKAQAKLQPSPHPCTIRLLSWNVHGNLALKMRTAWFQDELARWDITLFQETHLRPGQDSQLQLPPGFDCLSMARPESTRMTHQQGGLLAVFRATLGVENITPPVETELMVLRVAGISIVNVYLPPVSSPWNPDPAHTPFQRLVELVTPLASQLGSCFLLVGDFNARLGQAARSLPRVSPDTGPSTERGTR